MSAGWLVVIASMLLHACLGTIYAWSFFQPLIMAEHGWSNAAVAWTFSGAIACLGLAAAIGGMLLPRWGARRLALIGSVGYAGAFVLAGVALARGSLPLLWLGFGGLGGIGLGLAYVVPVATVVRWFPARKGLVSGLVVMGFGLGALLMTKLLAPLVLAHTNADLAAAFTWLGLLLALVMMPLALLVRDPPASAVVEQPMSVSAVLAHVRSRDFVLLWGAFTGAIGAGIMLIGFQSPMLQDLLRQRDATRTTTDLALAGANLIAVAAVANGVGRLLWGALSDRIGRAWALRAVLAVQTVAFVAMMIVPHPSAFALLTCIVLLCYGGAFGTVPALVAQRFGSANMAVIYGAVLTGWSFGGVVGPQLAAWLRDHAVTTASATGGWIAACGGALALVGLMCACGLRDQPPSSSSATPATPHNDQ